MSDRGGGPSIELADGPTAGTSSASSPPSLPLPVSQLIVLFGLLLIGFGAFTLASGADIETPLGAPPDLVGQLDCNKEGDLCRYTSPTGAVTWLCVAPCDIPPGVGFGGEPVFEFGGSDGIPIDGLAVNNGGELVFSETGAAIGREVRVGADGRIELDGGQTEGVRVERGLLPFDEPDDRASFDGEESEIEERPSSPSSNAPGGGSGLSALARVLAPIALLLGLGLFGVGVLAIVRAVRARSRRDDDDDELDVEPLPHIVDDAAVENVPAPPDAMAAVAAERVRIVSDLIGDLRAEPDPSVAIQRAYAALETGFGNRTLARLPSETCSTYLHRTIGMVGGVSEPLRTLTLLFELARFSTEPIDEAMRGQAIDALIAVRSAWSSRTSTSRSLLSPEDGRQR